MRVLVTGAYGFVGAWLTAELMAHDHEVIASDKDAGEDADLALPYAGELLLKRTKPDYLVHLAARYGRLLCRDEPHRAVADNTASTVELAANAECPILYASSSEVYGDHGTALITEESELRMPTTIYGLSKRWGEEAVRLYHDDPLIVRMNMLYGPEQIGGYGRCSLATFIRSAVRKEPFEVHYGTSRSWLYALDAVRALRMLIEGGHAGVYNLGNPAPAIPMTEVAEMVGQLTGGGYTLTDPPEGQIAHKMYDVSKLLAAIDWRPTVELERGIASTIEWAEEEAALHEHRD